MKREHGATVEIVGNGCNGMLEEWKLMNQDWLNIKVLFSVLSGMLVFLLLYLSSATI